MALGLVVGKAKRDLPAAAELTAQIAATRDEIEKHAAEAQRLNALASAELDDDRAEALLIQVRAEDRAARRGRATLAALQEQHAAAELRERQAQFAMHRERVVTTARRAIAATEAAAAANAASVTAIQDAERALGNRLVDLWPKTFFAGIAVPDTVAIWRTHVERDLAALERMTLPRPPTPLTAEQREEAMKAAAAARQSPGYVGRTGAVTLAQPSAPPPGPTDHLPRHDFARGAVRLGETPQQAAPPAPARAPRADPPPPEGQQQVAFLRPGVELPDGQQSVIGDRVNLPATQARRLLEAGAVDLAATDG